MGTSENRDERGRFVKGFVQHPVSERKPGDNLGGRPKGLKAQTQEAIDKLEGRLPVIFDKMAELAERGNIAAAEYIVNRILGKPRQSTELEGGVELLDMLERLAKHAEGD